MSLKTGSTRLICLSITLESVLKFPRTRSANLVDSNLNYSVMVHYIRLFLCYLRATFPIKVSTIRRRASLYTVKCVTSFTSAIFYSWCSFIEKPTRPVWAYDESLKILLIFISTNLRLNLLVINQMSKNDQKYYMTLNFELIHYDK